MKKIVVILLSVAVAVCVLSACVGNYRLTEISGGMTSRDSAILTKADKHNDGSYGRYNSAYYSSASSSYNDWWTSVPTASSAATSATVRPSSSANKSGSATSSASYDQWWTSITPSSAENTSVGSAYPYSVQYSYSAQNSQQDLPEFNGFEVNFSEDKEIDDRFSLASDLSFLHNDMYVDDGWLKGSYLDCAIYMPPSTTVSDAETRNIFFKVNGPCKIYFYAYSDSYSCNLCLYEENYYYSYDSVYLNNTYNLYSYCFTLDDAACCKFIAIGGAAYIYAIRVEYTFTNNY